MEFIEQHGLEALHPIYTDPMVRSTVFVPTENVNTFYYLAVLMPILLPTFLADFSDALARLIAGFERRIVIGRVLQVETTAKGTYRIRTSERDLSARHLVIATPCHNTRRFFPALEESPVQEVPMCTLHVAGYRKREYRPGKIVFLPRDHAATVLCPLPGNHDLLFAQSPDVDLGTYFDDAAMTACVEWKTAILLSGATWRPLQPRPNLFTIGDHNICGLEDSYLTGLFAANRIAEQTQAQRRPYVSRPGLTGSPVR
jgi:hypothetical protein